MNPHSDTLAFRVPHNQDLIDILHQTGPLVAPSANMSGGPTVKSLKQAYDVFGDSVDGYYGGALLALEPSTLVRVKNGAIDIIRIGADYDKIKDYEN